MKKLLPIFAGITFIFLVSTMSKRALSKTGYTHLKFEEGKRLTVYTDEAGYSTIGYGHKLLPNENYHTITDAIANDLLVRDVNHAENIINEYFPKPLTQHEFDALVSWAYNVGKENVRTSTLREALNALNENTANYNEAKQFLIARELPRWNKVTINGNKQTSNVLSQRRDREVLISQGQIPQAIQHLV